MSLPAQKRCSAEMALSPAMAAAFAAYEDGERRLEAALDSIDRAVHAARGKWPKRPVFLIGEPGAEDLAKWARWKRELGPETVLTAMRMRQIREVEAYVAARDAVDAAHGLPVLHEAEEAAVKHHSDTFVAIVRTPAENLADLRAKLRLMIELDLEKGLTIEQAYSGAIGSEMMDDRLLASAWADAEQLTARCGEANTVRA